MEPFHGFEPQVGQIRAVRTFRIGPGGVLYPLFGVEQWADGANTARCRDAGDHQSPVHDAPHPDCSCGFYGYGDAATAEFAHARDVLGVLSCWGRVIAGTRGVRAEHARIEALWMSPIVPETLAAEVRSNYPSTRCFADRRAMLREHPPSRLDCYESMVTTGPASSHSWSARTAIAATVAVGVLPAGYLAFVPAWRELLAIACCSLLARAFVLGRRPRADLASRRRSLLCVALGLWLATPVLGFAGVVLLRLPLLQLAGLSLVQRATVLRLARRFPAEIR